MIIIKIIFKIIKKIYNIINKIIKFNNKIYDEKMKAMEYCGRLFFWLFIFMATFTSEELHQGKDQASLTGATTFTFTNTGASAYFTLVQNTGVDANTGFIPGLETSYISGSFSSLSSVSLEGIVENKFKFGIVIPEGGGSFVFTPTDTTGNGSIKFRGTGNISLTTS